MSETFETIGYNSNLDREEGEMDSLASKTGLFETGLVKDEFNEVNKKVSGNDLEDLWIKSWIKSRNYKPKSQGFLIDGKTGRMEGMGLYVGGGTITGATIQTAESPTPRVVIDGTNFIQTYDSNYLRVKIDTSSIKFYEETTGTLGATLYGETNLGQFGFNADSDYFSISSSINEDAVFYLLSPNYWGSIVMVNSGAYEGELLIQTSSSLITIQGDLLPLGDSFYTLGATGRKWMNLYLSGNINMEEGGKVDGVDISVMNSSYQTHASNASAHHSSTSAGLAIKPSSVTSTDNYIFNTTANKGFVWDPTGQSAAFWFDNDVSDNFAMTHSLIIGASTGKSLSFGGTARMTGNATDFTFNRSLEPNANRTLDLGNNNNFYWRTLYTQGINLNGTYRSSWPTSGVSDHGSLSGVTVHQHHNAYSNGYSITPYSVISSSSCNLAGLTVNGTLQPNASNTRYCGTSGAYWARVYSDAYFTKNLSFQLFDKYDDLQILRDLKFGKKNELIIEDLPKEIAKDGFINFGGMTSFNLCASKKMVECIDDLKKQIDILNNRFKQLEKNEKELT